ncbi:spore maturation protein [Paenibacillus glufosinatiresistens]|uniref:spore maturation protein n=1 Tax=Paenibacillus glufosinatiresistens TaxID=3070657 RepID=UPI00286E2ADD|nr:spore maturation protein [Paenibacillus sp. YX.27]
MYAFLSLISSWAIPVLVAFIPLYAYTRKVPVYESFVTGAKEGFGTAIGIIPPLIGMLVAISVFRASGALDFFMGLISPALEAVGIPPEVLPLGLLRPLTGTGSLAYTTELIRVHGPDSLIGMIASTIQGSTDTTLYVLTVYFGAVGIRNGRYALKVGLFSDLVGFAAAIAVCLLTFR